MLLDLDPDRILIAVDPHLDDALDVAGAFALRQSALREREKYQASPLSTVRLSASAFMCATIRSSPLSASVATQVTRPSASNFGASTRPSSISGRSVASGKASLLTVLAPLAGQSG